ncbi:MAG: hypothetical protein E6K55_05600 [Gemmatimonadetes bacterium]|nr:MAG: hypothetical protein E6K55_05600 [Gemmatimonadota bacterium]
MVRTVGRNWWAVAAAMLAIASACEEPQSPESRPKLLLTDGATLAVDATTTFALPDVSSTGSLDPDGYTVWVDASASQPVGTNGVVTFSGLAAGDHEVALYGIASNCSVSTPDKGSNNPRGVSIVAVGGSSDFSLACGSWGELFVSTNTSGVDLPAGGYTVSVDGGASQTIAANGSVTFMLLYAASHTVVLSGVAGNCTLTGSNSQQVNVSAGQTTSITFSGSCTPIGSGSGALTVTTSTTGSNPDADGYTVTVDGTASQAVATNGSATFAVPAGANPVALSGVASNCAVSGANPGTVTVPAGGTGTTTIAVTCFVPGARVSGTGQIGLGTATPHQNVQTFDFDVRADLTGRFYITAYDDIHPDGTIAMVFVDPSADPATFFKAYRTSSNVCSDPSHGVEFDALGRDAPDLVNVTGIVCDDGPQGSGRDFLSFFIIKPNAAGIGRSGMVTSGDIVKN